jgi:tetratricopeptide (TPR) repeat protein
MSNELIGAIIGLGGALFGALVAGGISLRNFRQSQRRESAAAFREVLQKLVDLRIQVNSTFREYADDAGTREFLSGALNVKRQLYKATAAGILVRASDELAANDYVTLGYEYQNDSEFENARSCYLAALEKTGDSRLDRVNVLRNLGALLLQPTTLHDRSTAEGYFREAVELSNGQPDDYSRYTTGYTYEMLGIGLLANRYPEWRPAIQAARENYEAMTPTNSLRQAALDSLDLRQGSAGLAFAIPPTKSPPSPADAAALETGKGNHSGTDGMPRPSSVGDEHGNAGLDD